MDDLLKDLHALLKKHNTAITVNNNEFLIIKNNTEMLKLDSLSRTSIIDHLKESK